MVINHIGKVVSRKAVRFKKYRIIEGFIYGLLFLLPLVPYASVHEIMNIRVLVRDEKPNYVGISVCGAVVRLVFRYMSTRSVVVWW